MNSQNNYWQKLWNKLGGTRGLAELLDSSWLKTKKHKPTGKPVVWERYGEHRHRMEYNGLDMGCAACSNYMNRHDLINTRVDTSEPITSCEHVYPIGVKGITKCLKCGGTLVIEDVKPIYISGKGEYFYYDKKSNTLTKKKK